VAAALRYLALGVPIVGFEEGSQLSPAVLERFFFGTDRQVGPLQNTVGWFVGHFQAAWIHPPRTEAELSRVLKVSGLCGFPGAITNMDAVHTAWDNAASQYRYLYTGKEGYPTLVSNVNVSHTRWVVQCMDPTPEGRMTKLLSRMTPSYERY